MWFDLVYGGLSSLGLTEFENLSVSRIAKLKKRMDEQKELELAESERLKNG